MLELQDSAKAATARADYAVAVASLTMARVTIAAIPDSDAVSSEVKAARRDFFRQLAAAATASDFETRRRAELEEQVRALAAAPPDSALDALREDLAFANVRFNQGAYREAASFFDVVARAAPEAASRLTSAGGHTLAAKGAPASAKVTAADFQALAKEATDGLATNASACRAEPELAARRGEAGRGRRVREWPG